MTVRRSDRADRVLVAAFPQVAEEVEEVVGEDGEEEGIELMEWLDEDQLSEEAEEAQCIDAVANGDLSEVSVDCDVIGKTSSWSRPWSDLMSLTIFIV